MKYFNSNTVGEVFKESHTNQSHKWCFATIHLIWAQMNGQSPKLWNFIHITPIQGQFRLYIASYLLILHIIDLEFGT